MTYRCQDCSHQKSTQFSSGSCPACGSFNIVKLKSANQVAYEKQARKPFRLVLLMALWIYLIYQLYQKLSS